MLKNTLKFTKMNGLGNDFIIVDGKEVSEKKLQYDILAKKMCDRNFGVGADGLIIVNPLDVIANTDTSWRIINSDGSEPQMCGNGIRCFAKYVYEKGIIDKKKFTVWTLAGTITPEILDNGEVKVDMGKPILEAAKIPVITEELDCVINYPLEIDENEFNITAVSMGNPHCVIFTDNDTALLARKFGSKIETHPMFPEKTNVEFVKILSRNNIKIDVWERGCGITLACGTGACASTVAAILNDLTDYTVKADLPGGSLTIEWNKDQQDASVFMTGKSEFVFEGEYIL
ncbi:MAG: diaminopimelate epimerase [bacterium]